MFSTGQPWKEISPGQRSPSPRWQKNVYTSVSLKPSRPHSTGELLRACWHVASLSGVGTVVQRTARPFRGQWAQLNDHRCPSSSSELKSTCPLWNNSANGVIRSKRLLWYWIHSNNTVISVKCFYTTFYKQNIHSKWWKTQQWHDCVLVYMVYEDTNRGYNGMCITM